MDIEQNDAPTLERGTTLGDYRIVSQLGEGGMGIVFLATQLGLEREVALKVMQPHIARQGTTRERFEREAKISAAVEHERIVRIYQVSEFRGIPFIAMELLRGESLDKRLQRETIPPLAFSCRVILHTAQGLAAAHRRGLIHRDIKPSNIFLVPEIGKVDFSGKILDFGLARATEGDAISAQSGKILGTPAYMSPEQWRGKEVDYRTDLFSLGVMFYQMTTGQFPFGSGNHIEIARAVALDDPVPPVQIRPELPPPISDLILKMIEKDKLKRVADADEVIARLEAYFELEARQRLEAEWQARIEARLREEEERRLAKEPASAPPPLPEAVKPPVVRPEPPLAAPPVAPKSREIDPKKATPSGIGRLPRSKDSLSRPVIPTSSKSPKPREDEVRKGRPSEFEAKRTPDAIRRPSSARPPVLDCVSARGMNLTLVQAAQKTWARYLGVSVVTTVDLSAEVRMEFVLVPPGKFIMGSPKSERERREYEVEHEVSISRPFFLGRFPVTQGEYETLTGANPSYFRSGVVPVKDTSRYPVEKVSWPQAKEFCARLAKEELPRGFRLVRLPTEAEWEFACRAGTRTVFHFGDALDGREANCDGTHPYQTEEKGTYLRHPCEVGSYLPNPLGLCDMHGNVWEWCEDGWEERAYEKKRSGSDLFIEPLNDRRVLRGGSWTSPANLCRSANRNWYAGSWKDNSFGFRVMIRFEE